MHIPDNMINGAVCPVTAAFSLAGVIAAAAASVKSRIKPGITQFASVTAFIFAAQMMNFPVLNGTSGHLTGTVIAIALLGVPFGVLSVSLVLAVQCILFADGGITVLGANILNMVLIPAMVYMAAGKTAQNGKQDLRCILPVSWLSVMLASAACSLELAFSGAVSLFKVLPSMLSVHALIGVGEGIITAAVLSVFSVQTLKTSDKKRTFLLSASAFFTAVVLTRFASPFPDGLESAAGKYSFLNESVPVISSVFPDYAAPFIQNTFISAASAGITGILAIYAVAVIAGRTGLLLPDASRGGKS